MTQNQQTTLSALRAGVGARNIKVNEQVRQTAEGYLSGLDPVGLL
jgi:hypothetical protein